VHSALLHQASAGKQPALLPSGAQQARPPVPGLPRAVNAAVVGAAERNAFIRMQVPSRQQQQTETKSDRRRESSYTHDVLRYDGGAVSMVIWCT
jgi:hypothetical protein